MEIEIQSSEKRQGDSKSLMTENIYCLVLCEMVHLVLAIKFEVAYINYLPFILALFL